MRIAHLHWYYGRAGGGGVEQSLPQLCSLLEARGHSNSVLYQYDLGAKDVVEGRSLYHISGLCDPMQRQGQAQKETAVLDALEREQPDVLHVHGMSDARLVGRLASRWPCLLFVHGHDYSCPTGSRYWRRQAQVCDISPGLPCLTHIVMDGCGSRRPKRALGYLRNYAQKRQVLNAVHAVAVDSQYMKEQLVAAGVASDLVAVTATVTELPPLADLDRIWKPGHLLYVGRLIEEKGLQVLLQALRYLPTSVRLTVVGEGYARQRMESLAARLCLGGRVDFVGHVLKRDLAPYFLSAAVCVVPSQWPEPFGLVGTEAMSYGLPVVGSAVGAIPEWLADGETGYLVPPGDDHALADRLAALLADPALAERMGRAGRERVEGLFHPQHHVDSMLKIYADTIARFRKMADAPLLGTRHEDMVGDSHISVGL